jgi:hypothetical protein
MSFKTLWLFTSPSKKCDDSLKVNSLSKNPTNSLNIPFLNFTLMIHKKSIAFQNIEHICKAQ